VTRSAIFFVRTLALALALLPATASAFCRSTTCRTRSEDCGIDANGCATVGVPVRWRSMPIPYRFHRGGSGLLLREEARAAIRAAFHRWSDAMCAGRRTSLRFQEQEDAFDDKPLDPQARAAEPFGIFFRDLGWPYEGREDSALAQTNLHFLRTSGLIEYADLEINSGARRFSTAEFEAGVDLQAVMTHEVGHYIGLSHSREFQSIMTLSYCEAADQRCEKGKVAARRLAPDDIAGVCALYPPDGYEEPPAEDEGCSTAAARARSARAPSAAVFAAALVVGLSVTRRRRR
jgi:hypothetical protein